MKKRLHGINIVILIGVLVMVGAGVWIVKNFVDYNQANRLYEDIAKTVATAAPEGQVGTAPSFEEWLELTGADNTSAMEEATGAPEQEPGEAPTKQPTEVTKQPTEATEAPTEQPMKATEAPTEQPMEQLMEQPMEAGMTALPAAEATQSVSPTLSTVLPSSTPTDPPQPFVAQTEAPSPQEQAAAEQRADDEEEAQQQYSQLASQENSIANRSDLLRHSDLLAQYRQWLIDENYAVDTEYEEAVGLLDFSQLQQQNEDVVAWLTSEGTVIDYPVVQGDDNEFYLHHLFDRSTNANGTLFVDMYNAGDFSDKNTVIYGHHMRNQSMFASLVGYKEQEYYEEHPTMMLYTPTATYRVELFAGYIVQMQSENNPCFTMTFDSDERFMEWVMDAVGKSTFHTEVEVKPEDRVVTLCTCTYEVYNARYVLLGKLTQLSRPIQ